jgi:hypothetical protein
LILSSNGSTPPSALRHQSQTQALAADGLCVAGWICSKGRRSLTRTEEWSKVEFFQRFHIQRAINAGLEPFPVLTGFDPLQNGIR